LQGTGEGRPFSNCELNCLLDNGRAGIRGLMRTQRQALAGFGGELVPLPRLVVATENAHKLRELREILGGVCELVSMKEAGFEGEIDENGTTFEQNAAIKAEAVMKVTGLPALADDSGLAVDALGGEPGVRSARYAGDHGDDGANKRLLLERMSGVKNRACKFVCAMALALPGQETQTVTGECSGTLLTEERGSDGFGYDPLFLYETGETFAEMSGKAKNAVSHRAHASARMRALLERCL
jgi:non-canonical purine NTP pyrophosphatase (RdgB/HAM1 family)